MNEFYVLNEQYKLKGVVDNYKSAIWSERFYVNGDFEIYAPNNTYNYNILKLNATLYIPVFITRADDTTKMGILTNVKYVHSAEDGDMIIASGFTDDYLLHYRVIFEQSSYIGNAEYALRHMVRNAMIDSGFHMRNISNIVLGAKIGLSDNYKVNVQLLGEYLDDAVANICKDQGIGFIVRFNPSNNVFSFNVLPSQERPNIIFSASLDNLLSSEYDHSTRPNTVYAIGEGNGVDKLVGMYTDGQEQQGLYRQEYYVNGERISSNGDSFNILTYVNLLTAQGKRNFVDKFGDNELVQSSVDTNSYKLGVDYNLGDIVTVIIMAGTDQSQMKPIKQRVIEVVECWDETGYKIEPAFEAI